MEKQITVIDPDGNKITIPRRGRVSTRDFYVTPAMQQVLLQANLKAESKPEFLERAIEIEDTIFKANIENDKYYAELKKAEDKKWEKIKAKRNKKRGRK